MTKRHARHLAIALSAAAVFAAGCSDDTRDPVPATLETDSYSVEFPGAYTQQSQDTVNGTLTINSARLGEDAYTVAEADVPEGSVVDLDGAVSGAVNGAGGELVSSETITVSGQDARSFVATVTQGGETAEIRGVVVSSDGLLLQVFALDVGGDDVATAESFVGSLVLR